MIVAGESAIDEAPVTGESAPVRKGVDGNGLRRHGQRRRRAARPGHRGGGRQHHRPRRAAGRGGAGEQGADRALHRPLLALLHARRGRGRAPWSRSSRRCSSAASWGAWIYKGLAILLIGCPCALVISTPAAIAAASRPARGAACCSRAARCWRTLGKITAVAFDKTGTLTDGKPKVTDVVRCQAGASARCCRSRRRWRRGSSHPLALAILDRAAGGWRASAAGGRRQGAGGKGVTGRVGGETLFLASAQAAGERIALTPEQTAQIAALNDAGKTVSVLLVGEIATG